MGWPEVAVLHTHGQSTHAGQTGSVEQSSHLGGVTAVFRGLAADSEGSPDWKAGIWCTQENSWAEAGPILSWKGERQRQKEKEERERERKRNERRGGEMRREGKVGRREGREKERGRERDMKREIEQEEERREADRCF